MYQWILAAIDGSETSNLALQEAIKLAKDQKAALRLIHVVDESSAYMALDLPALSPNLIDEMQKVLRGAGE